MTAAELVRLLAGVPPDTPVMIEADVGQVLLLEITATLANGLTDTWPAQQAVVLTADPAAIAMHIA